MLTIEKLTIMQPLFAHLMTNKFLDEGFLNQFQDTNDKASRFLHFAGAALSFRRVCVTEQGRMAIVPPHSLPKDVICIIKGARMLYVLRKRSEGERQFYNLVGCCYVHGIMDGEICIQETDTFVIA
jgi:hypothetical protein